MVSQWGYKARIKDRKHFSVLLQIEESYLSKSKPKPAILVLS